MPLLEKGYEKQPEQVRSVHNPALWSIISMEMRRVDTTSENPPFLLPIQPDRSREGPCTQLRVLGMDADV